MPDGGTLLLFAAAALSINWTPGPDMLYVVARSLGDGRRAGIISALGLSVGYVVYTLLAASGLAALLAASPAAFSAVRVAGAAYLLYLGVRAIIARPATLPQADIPAASVPAASVPAASIPAPTATPRRAIFRQGALTSTLNPSIAVFFLAFLPQFVDAARGAVWQQIGALGLVFVVTATLTHTTIALLAGTAGGWLGRRQGMARFQGWITGGLLILLGARVLLGG